MIVILDGEIIYFTTAATLMDDEIRERLRKDLAPCEAQDFIDAYCVAHLAKYNEPFVIGRIP